MSTLKVTNIQATGETASRAVSGVAAAWAFFDGTGTPSIYGSLNTSSLTDNGTGKYFVNFTNNMSSATTYSGVTNGGRDNDGVTSFYQGDRTTARYGLRCYSIDGTRTPLDYDSVGGVINGDLA
jgi:hypothetical protein